MFPGHHPVSVNCLESRPRVISASDGANQGYDRQHGIVSPVVKRLANDGQTLCMVGYNQTYPKANAGEGGLAKSFTYQTNGGL